MEIKKIFEENKTIIISVFIFFVSLIVLGSLVVFVLSNNKDNPITSFFGQNNTSSLFNANTSIQVDEEENITTPTTEPNSNDNSKTFYSLDLSFKSKKINVQYDKEAEWISKEPKIIVGKQDEKFGDKQYNFMDIVYLPSDDKYYFIGNSIVRTIRIVDTNYKYLNSPQTTQNTNPAGTVEITKCTPIKSYSQDIKAVECEYFYIPVGTSSQSSTGKVISCYVPILNENSSYVEFSVKSRPDGVNIDMCDEINKMQLRSINVIE